MTKEEFIHTVSKIHQTGEDEFRAEFNSPELIWVKVVGKIEERMKELERDLDLEKCDHIFTNDISEERYQEIKQLEQRVKELEQLLEIERQHKKTDSPF